jgi:hypothetical protein
MLKQNQKATDGDFCFVMIGSNTRIWQIRTKNLFVCVCECNVREKKIENNINNNNRKKNERKKKKIQLVEPEEKKKRDSLFCTGVN